MIEMILLTCCVLAVIMAIKEFWLGMAIALIVGLLVLVGKDIIDYFRGE